MCSGRQDIAVEKWFIIGVGYEEIQPAVIIEISHCNTAAVFGRVQPVTRRFIFEDVAVFVMKQPLLLITAQRLVPDRGPIARIGEIHSGTSDHFKNIWHIAFLAPGHPAVHDIEIEPAVVVIVKELSGPSPARIVRAGFTRDVGERQVPIVVPEKVSLAHVIVSDIRDVNVKQAVIVKVSPIHVHALLGIKADGGLCLVSKSAVAVVNVKTVCPKIIGYVQVFESVIVGIAMPQIQRPAGGVDAADFRHISEGSVLIVMKHSHAAAILGSLKTFWKKPGCAGMKDVDWLEIRANEQINVAIIVIIKGNCLDGVHVAIKSRRFGNIAKFSIAQVQVEDRAPEPHDKQVWKPIVVEIEPEGAGRGVFFVIPVRDTGFLGNVSKSKITVVVVQVVFAGCARVGHKNIFKAIAIKVGHGHRGPKFRVTLHDLSVRIVESASMVT